VMTDHLIRRKPLRGDLLALMRERHDRQTGPVKLLRPAQLPKTPESRVYVAVAQLRASANLAQDASGLHGAILRARPIAAEPYTALGEAYAKLGRTEAAIAAFRASLERDQEEVSTYVALANVLLAVNRPGEALTLVADAVKRLGQSVPLLNSLSVIYGRLQRFEDGLDAASQALRVNPEDPVSWLNLGVCLHAKGEKKGAEAAYRQAILLQPELTQARDNLKLLLENQL
jgi:tetratricopeptide (TPR) repeat protein